MKNLKKLGKLKLMPEKMLNQEELVNFRGGSFPAGEGECDTVTCWYCAYTPMVCAVSTYCCCGLQPPSPWYCN